MTVLYADTSALACAYLADEPEHGRFRKLLLGGGQLVVTSELARVEIASAVQGAARRGRIASPDVLLTGFDGDCEPGGRIVLIGLVPGTILPAAHGLVRRFRLRTLDAIHLAVAAGTAWPMADGDLLLVTRDRDQASAARALGLPVA